MLQIILYSDEYDADGNRLSKFQLQLPALTPNKWTEVFAKIKGRIGNGHKRGPVRFMTLRCVNTALCDGLDVHMDDFRLVQDRVTRVKKINGTTSTLEQPAERSAAAELVYHDDTAAARAWLQAAQEESANLFAPAGTYYISEILPLYSDTHLRCAGADRTIFKNSGGSRTGTSKLLSTKDAAVAAPANIVIEHCGFDVIRGFLPAQTENVHIVDNFIRAVREREVPGRLLGPRLNIAGIQLKRAVAATDPAGAAQIRIEGNTVLATGEHAVFNGGGMIFQGPLRTLRVSNNHVRCNNCRSIHPGILIRLGVFGNLALHDNIVVGATDALRLGGTSRSQLVITDANIYDNQFLRSTRDHLGQITVQLVRKEDLVQARIADNYLHGGVGPGVLCTGSGDRELLIEANSIHTPADQEDIAGCSADGGAASP